MALEARSYVAAGQLPHGISQRTEIVPELAQGGAKRSGVRSVERPRDELVMRVLDQHRCGGAKQRSCRQRKVFVDHQLAFIRRTGAARARKSYPAFY